MNREVHVRFWESPEVKVLRATRHIVARGAASILTAAHPPIAAIPGGCRCRPAFHAAQQSYAWGISLRPLRPRKGVGMRRGQTDRHRLSAR